MTTIYLDIETERGPTDDQHVIDDITAKVGPPPSVPDPSELTPPRSYKDPAKIEEWRAKRHAELTTEAAGHDDAVNAAIREEWERSPLVPERGRILCVGVARDDHDPVCLWEATERDTLGKLEGALSRYPDAEFVAWNGLGFDFRYLAIRALHYGFLDLARAMYAPRPWGNRRHHDPRDAWVQSWRGNVTGRLPTVARLLGVECPPDTITGADVPVLWHGVKALGDGDPRRDEVIAQIRQHVIHDVACLRGVHRRMSDAGWV